MSARMDELTPRAGLGAVVRDALAVAALASVVFQALRQWVGDRYLVPSESMQPTLYGDEHRGDVVFVDKLASAADLRRHDLAVFHSPEGPGILVKRVAALGDEPQRCWIELRNGDLWLGPNSQHLEREVKEPLDSRDLRVPWFRWPAPEAAAERVASLPL